MVSTQEAAGVRRRGPPISVEIHGEKSHESGSGDRGSASSKVIETNENEAEEAYKRSKMLSYHDWKIPTFLDWIPTRLNWSDLKPVVRSAFAAWIALVLFVIPKVQIFWGQASFLILIASVFSPPSDPFICVLERELLIMLLATLTWAWACLGIEIANLTRTERAPPMALADVVDGQYIETKPSIILGLFLFLGSFMILFVKARQGPGPYIFACVLACICLGLYLYTFPAPFWASYWLYKDISLTTAALFPFPFFKTGQQIVLPLVFHSAIALVVSVLVFPVTLSAQFNTCITNVLAALTSAVDQHKTLLELSPIFSITADPSESDSRDFPAAVSKLSSTVANADAALTPLAAAARLLPSDLIYSRYSPVDFMTFRDFVRRLSVRANGMAVYFELIEPTRERFPITPVTTAPPTPTISRSGSPTRHRARSGADSAERGPNHGRTSLLEDVQPVNTQDALMMRRGRQGFKSTTPPLSPTHSRQSSYTNLQRHHHHLHYSLFHLHRKGFQRHDFYREENPVGVFESQRYLNLEATRFSDPMWELWTGEMVRALKECATPLLSTLGRSLKTLDTFFSSSCTNRFKYLLKTTEVKALWARQLADSEKTRDELQEVLEHFRREGRHRILDPYRSVFGDTNIESMVDRGDDEPHHPTPAHRYLFQAFVYQYHLILFAIMVINMLDEIIRLQELRTTQRLWTPVQHLLRWSNWQITPDSAERGEDEDPDVIQGLSPETQLALEELNLPQKRDPDALPPRNWFERIMEMIYKSMTGLAGGNLLFAIKASVLTVLLSLPSFFKSSAFFAYENRFVWAIVMGQVTIARFQGDTTFGLITRVFSTFVGGVAGMVMWYISCGSGRGNPFGLAAVCAVCFPFLFFARLYWPGPPMTIIVLCVTCILVIGYSYLDVHQMQPGNPGFGFSVAWRRFVLVTVGVFAAFVMSFFPPATTIRKYQRNILATTCSELGAIYCAIVSFANLHRAEDEPEIVTSLSAIRSKLTRSRILRTNASYEFSLRGPWPVERYQTLFRIQFQTAYVLSHLMSIFKHLEPAWGRALLKRTRLIDTDFQGDILAVMTMISTSLRTGSPLPQITPCPLLDRFALQYHGFDVIHKESEEDYGLPRRLTLETLQNEQYLYFCVGVSTAASLMVRLDRLMVAAKEIVGEQFHISGIGAGVPFVHTNTKGSDPGGRANVRFYPPAEV